MVSTQLEQTRQAALSVVRGIVLPRISRKLIAEFNNSGENDYRLLGRIVGQHERVLKARFDSITNSHELNDLRLIYREEELEHSIRSKYLIERFKKLKPMVDKITSQLSRIETELGCIDRVASDSQALPDVIDDTLLRFGIVSQDKCAQKQLHGELS